MPLLVTSAAGANGGSLHISAERVNSDHTSGSDPDFSQFPQDFVHIDASGLFTELVASVWSASTSPRSRTLTWILHDTGSDRLGITAIYLFESHRNACCRHHAQNW